MSPIYIVPKPSDMTGRCPSCFADIERLAEAVKAGAVNFCTDPAHGEASADTDDEAELGRLHDEGDVS